MLTIEIWIDLQPQTIDFPEFAHVNPSLLRAQYNYHMHRVNVVTCNLLTCILIVASRATTLCDQMITAKL